MSCKLGPAVLADSGYWPTSKTHTLKTALQFGSELREMKGPHFALVLSGKVFNQQGLAMICPVSQGADDAARTYGTVVTLMGTGTDTQGAVHCHQLKSLDWRARNVRFKESVPQHIVDEVLARVEALLND